MKITDIKNKDLLYMVERIEPYFASSIIIRGMVEKNNVHKILGWKNGVRWVYANDLFLVLRKDMITAKKQIKAKFKNEGNIYAQHLIRKCFEYGNTLLKESKNISIEAKQKNLTKEQISILLSRYLRAASNFMIFQNIVLFEDSVAELSEHLAAKYSRAKSRQKLLELITTSSNLTSGEKERDDFLWLCMSPERTRLAKVHARKYGWLSIRFFVGNPWSKTNVLERFKDLSPTKAKKELALRIKLREEKERKIKQVIANFQPRDKQLVQLIRDIVYLRTQRTDFFQESSYYIQSLLKIIAKILGITYEELLYLSAEEVLKALKNKINYRTLIEKRRIGFVVLFDFDGDKILEAEKALSFIKNRPILGNKIKEIKNLTGTISFKGFTQGTVRIVKSDKDNRKVKKGDIIVSIMTTPNFIPAMERASAFITDEGGVTCHAAIIAREMKKPCITGTKIATRIFKDGDMVEVDANRGIVKKL